MTASNLPDAAFTPSEDTAPSWEDMRQGGCMLIDDSLQKLAVYAGGGGSVVLMEEDCDSDLRFVVIEHDKVPALVAALTKAQAEAAEIWAEVEKEIEAYEAAGSGIASGEVGSHR
ncbi:MULTISPECIES: hypothetical protein [unclassified Variovorax]|uniref:hypothetical protein n=1 Tax=unclassified Variovorax TaxID=663243 RepID=UPI000A4973EB|nr:MULTISPECIES: hypothetical protein [unclassified Variovorax]PNG53199.1 hypothetical protein CHC06_04545 [Variovorax sp. B2]PNG53771.1 hypothetical protein CHC07_03592 [Variovorax sp. B4]VTV11225.1 hypothetical protein WDL1CHR_02106 [Variovorax sp. WDL1]